MRYIIAVVCSAVIGLFLSAIWIGSKVQAGMDKARKRLQDKKSSDNNNVLLNPTDFSVGRISTEKYQSSNLCNNKVLYPINGLDVDYGNKMPENCPCYQGITPP